MYFVQYEPLKSKLKDRSLTDQEAFPYLLVDVLLVTIALAVKIEAEHLPVVAVVDLILNVFVAIGGVFYVYEQNGGKNGVDLIRKYIVLGWVVTFRCVLIMTPVGLGLYIAAGVVGVGATAIFDALATALMQAIVYQRIGRHIRDTRPLPTHYA